MNNTSQPVFHPSISNKAGAIALTPVIFDYKRTEHRLVRLYRRTKHRLRALLPLRHRG